MNNYIDRAEIRKKLVSKLTPDEIDQAKGDFHAWREKCVSMLPIISGKDCPFGCTYCYIQSMGFHFKEPEPLRLSGEQICYTLLENKEFIVGRYGTPLAFGHISEPFLPTLLDNTLEYFKAISNYLGNPIQFATKMAVTADLAKKIKMSIKHKWVSPLVTITTLKHYKTLEPNAPPPEKRFKSITNLAKAGYGVFLYLRPLIPGVVDTEIEEILKTAQKAGAAGVVAGGFRITLPILNTMKQAGVNVSEIANRIPNIDERQRYIYTKDLEDKVIKLAHDVGLVSLRSTKCAVAYTCKVPAPSLYWEYNRDICTKCKSCEAETPKYKKPEVDLILKEVLADEEIISFQETKGQILIKVKTRSKAANAPKGTELSDLGKPRILETYFRRRVVIQRV